MTDSTYPLFPVVTFLGFVLPLIPLPWHLHALNSGTSYFIIWSSLACLNQFINSVVWAGNALNPAPIWCEISIRIMMAASVGIPASSLCINRRLYHIASLQAASITPAEKRRSILVDSLICLLFPLLYVALQYVVQGHRFNIFEDIGCYPALYNTLLTFFISSMWPLALGLVSAVYCVMSLRLFARRRAEFGHLLASNTSMTVSRYFRLMALAMTEICATTPLSIFMIYLNATANPVGPWRSWADTHFDYSRVEQIPAIVWRSNRLLTIGMEFSIWVTPVCSFIFFAFFGFAHESRKNYLHACSHLKRLLHISSPSAVLPKSITLQPPLYSNQANVKCGGSLSSDTLALPLHDLKRSISTESTMYNTTSDKESCTQPPTPQLSTVISAASSPSNELYTQPSISQDKRRLQRSRTL